MVQPGRFKERWIQPVVFLANNPISLIGIGLTTASAEEECQMAENVDPVPKGSEYLGLMRKIIYLTLVSEIIKL